MLIVKNVISPPLPFDSPPPPPPTSHSHFLDHYPDGLNANFLEPDAEGLEAKYAGAKGLFTDPETRDIARNVADIIKALGDLTGKKIVDLGAGTGLFLVPLDAAVGKEGHVYAVEISPGFIELLQKKKKTEGLRNTTVARGSVTDMGLPADLQADIVLLVDVYHHIEYVQTYMKNVRKGMRKGGKLVLIDFHRVRREKRKRRERQSECVCMLFYRGKLCVDLISIKHSLLRPLCEQATLSCGGTGVHGFRVRICPLPRD